MKKVKTIKGLLGKLKQVTDIDRDHIKGHDKLTDEQKKYCHSYSAKFKIL